MHEFIRDYKAGEGSHWSPKAPYTCDEGCQKPFHQKHLCHTQLGHGYLSGRAAAERDLALSVSRACWCDWVYRSCHQADPCGVWTMAKLYSCSPTSESRPTGDGQCHHLCAQVCTVSYAVYCDGRWRWRSRKNQPKIEHTLKTGHKRAPDTKRSKSQPFTWE